MRIPARTPPSWSAYHFATVAADAGLEAEVRLAETEQGDHLRLKVKESIDATFLVSL